VTPSQQADARALAGEGLSARAIGKRLGVSHVAVATALRQAEPAPLESSPVAPEPAPLPDVPALVVPPAPLPSRRPATPESPGLAQPAEPDDLSPKARDRAATAVAKAEIEAGAARDNLRGTSLLRDAMRSARWRRPI